jgi:RNA polymerase sigma factor (sigma-70 family)
MKRNLSLKSILTEQEIIDGCRSGDKFYQKALYERYKQKMLVVCLRYSKTITEAEDALQEGFIKVFKHIESFRQESKLSTWITRIMANTTINLQRRKMYVLPMTDIENVELIENEVSLSGLHFFQLLELVQSLPQGCQIIFNLYAIEGYNHREIGKLLGVSEGTSKSQYARAKALLQAKLLKESSYYSRYAEAVV